MREAPGRDDRYPLVRPDRGDRIPQCVADRHYTAETGERRGEAVHHDRDDRDRRVLADDPLEGVADAMRSEEHTSELQSLMRISYSLFCLKKKHINMNNKNKT